MHLKPLKSNKQHSESMEFFFRIKEKKTQFLKVEVQFQTDEEIYLRLFCEIFLYLRQNKPKNPWRGIVIYPSSNVDTADINHYRELFQSRRVSRIYLDELGETTSLPVGIATIKLIIEDRNTAIVAVRDLITRIQQEINIQQQQRQLLELIETILVYKFPRMSRKVIEEMFGLSDLKQTRVYQEGVEEGKQQGKEEERIESIPRLLKLDLSIEQIAQGLDLDLEEVRRQVENQSSNQD